MPLFQPSVLKKYINDLDRQKLSDAWKRFHTHFHDAVKQENIRHAKEEQYQEGFLRELFVDVFGYTLNPQPGYNLTTEYKNEKDSRKADGAILSDGAGNEKAVRAVIELKGTDTTDLGKIETQAFSYLHNHKGCTYVITSNFEKLRFYITDATDHEEFHLFDLDEERFALLYLCLYADNLLSDLPLTIKQLSLQQEDAVTKKLYADYSRFKTELYKDITSQNQQFDKLELFKKTQKLLDRLLFILFAEDRLLLPPNFMIRIVEEHKQVQKLRMQQSLYERFRIYFNDLKEGNADQEIFAYNGGLFEPDEVLDQLQISDEVLMKGVLGLSQYDYNTEVDVNILGHIFEHSLNQLEELQASLENTVVEKSKTRRKKEGVFYTPRYITKYIVENTIGSLCTEKKAEMQIAEEEYSEVVKKKDKRVLLQKLDDYRAWLLSLKICDPACGSAAFLNAALEFLIDEHSYIDELINKLMGGGLGFRWTPNDILEHNLYGVDINEEAVEIAKLSLWLRTAEKGRKLSDLSKNIKCGNSLIDDPVVAGDKAFNWQIEFKEVFDKGSFDVVIGNPPYVPSYTLKKLEKEFYYKRYYSSEYQINTYTLFIEKVFQLISVKGVYGFIVPNYFLSTKFDQVLRKLIFKDNYVSIILNTFAIFETAIVDTVILIGAKQNRGDTVIKSISSNLGTINERLKALAQGEWAYSKTISLSKNDVQITFSEAIKLKGEFELKELIDFKKGMQPYEEGKGNPKQTRDMMKNKVYHSIDQYDITYQKLLTASSIKRYFFNWEGIWIKYGDNLAAARKIEIFQGPRILLNRILSKQKFDACYIEDFYINNSDIFNLLPKQCSSNYSLKTVAALICSKLCSFYFKSANINLNRQAFPKINVNTLEQFPINEITKEADKLISSKVDIMLSNTRELHDRKKALILFVKAKFDCIKISQKLLDWCSLNYKAFLKELEKQKIKLSLPEQNEWLDYFEAEKKKAKELQEIIDRTDKEIDAMVYELYGLTEEEIRIVEEG